MNKARYDQANKKYDSAITLYNINYIYYSINRYSKTNKEIFFEIPYDIAKCYLGKNEREKAFKTILNGQNAMQQTYGFFSWEYATFMRKYLLDFYFDTSNYGLAYKDFGNLLLIYKKIGYSPNEMADIMRLCADIYTDQGKENVAIDLYKRAYDTISIQGEGMDYEIFTSIVNKICAYDVANNNSSGAIDLYKKTIERLKKQGKDQNELTAQMLMNLGNVYKNEESFKKAIECYKDAITIIKTLPNSSNTKQNLKIYLTTLKGLYESNHQIKEAEEIGLEITKHDRFSFLF